MTNRIDKVRDLINDSASAALIISDINRYYITNFKSSAGAVLITQNNVYLLLDFRYYEAALKIVDKSVSVVCYKKFYESLNDILKSENINFLHIETEHVTIDKLFDYKQNIKADILEDSLLSNLLSDIRAVKSEDEISKIRAAQKITEKSFVEILNFIRPGITEKKLSIELEYLMKLNGADDLAFDIISISGANTSLPHGAPTDKAICNGEFLTFDIGVKFDGYCSDMTRTIALGSVSDEMREIYEIVLEAHKRAASCIKADSTVAQVDLAAREYIESCGYGEYFAHSTGHGVGLEVHEKPTVYKTNDCILVPNMIITDEPGIYIPDKFGVRIEDMYLVTERGCEDLATIDKQLIIV